MKKLLTFILTAALLLCLASCEPFTPKQTADTTTPEQTKKHRQLEFLHPYNE